ncbi:MAG: hypothetical protein IJM45_08605, partial [Clostridia bacterium]|nr:hypothetical protein [Clostridia bacterium]
AHEAHEKNRLLAVLSRAAAMCHRKAVAVIRAAFSCCQYNGVRAEPAGNVPTAHIIAEGNIISEAASFARQGKHHSRPGAARVSGGDLSSAG